MYRHLSFRKSLVELVPPDGTNKFSGSQTTRLASAYQVSFQSDYSLRTYVIASSKMAANDVGNQLPVSSLTVYLSLSMSNFMELSLSTADIGYRPIYFRFCKTIGRHIENLLPVSNLTLIIIIIIIIIIQKFITRA